LIREAIKQGLHLKNGVIILPSGKPATVKQARHGYNVLALGPAHNRRSFTAGRIICWLTYGEPPNEDFQVDHINRVRHDDRPENLRWFSAAENALNVSHETKTKLRESCLRPRKRYKGADHPQAKLTSKQQDQIRNSQLTQDQLAKQFKVSQATISRVKNGRKISKLQPFLPKP
jgi:hypothetical protein